MNSVDVRSDFPFELREKIVDLLGAGRDHSVLIVGDGVRVDAGEVALVSRVEFRGRMDRRQFDRVLVLPSVIDEAYAECSLIRSAYKFVYSGGVVVSVVFGETMRSIDHRAREFRCWLEDLRIGNPDAVSFLAFAEDRLRPRGSSDSAHLVRIEKLI